MAIESINPATEETLATFDELSPGQVDEVIDAAHKAWKSWSRTPVTERERLMRGVAGYLRENKSRFSRLITLEMGKPIVEAEAEIEKCALELATSTPNNAERFLADPAASKRTRTRATWPSSRSASCLASCPGTSPSGRSSASPSPPLMAGNTAVLKHASNVPQCSLAIEEAFTRGGLPKVSFRSLLVRVGGRGAHHRGPARQSCDADRQLRDRVACGGYSRARAQEVGAGAGRLGPLYRAGRRRS